MDQDTTPIGAGIGRVVAAVDGSAATELVMEAVSRLPFAAEATILVLHVARWGRGHSPVAHALMERRGKETLARATGALDRVSPPINGRPRIETALVFGEPFVEIIRRARDLHADLVVVGRHGERRFLDAPLGTTAERVARKGVAAVLVATSMSARRYSRPLVAVDLSETCGRALALAKRLVGPDTGFDIVHAHEQDDDESAPRTAVEAFLERFDLRPDRRTLVLRAGDPRAVLLEEMRTRATDLVVLGTHGRSAVRQMLIGSVAEAVLRRAMCDVLIARDAGACYEPP